MPVQPLHLETDPVGPFPALVLALVLVLTLLGIVAHVAFA
jgi:hypothetical protein